MSTSQFFTPGHRENFTTKSENVVGPTGSVPATTTAATNYVPAGQYQPSSNYLGAPIVPYMPSGVNVSPTPTAFPDTSSIPLNPSGIGTITLASGFPGVAPLSYNFPQEQQSAYNNLLPYYNQLLSFAGGDLDLAKRMLENTYQQGMTQSTQQYENEAGNLGIVFPQEKAQLNTTQNQRGIMQSGFGKTEQGQLSTSQQLRQQAVDRAKVNRETQLASDRGFGLEQKQRGFGEDVFNLEKQRRDEATNMANSKYSIQSTQFNAQVAAAAADEQRRAQQAANDLQKNIYKQQGYTV